MISYCINNKTNIKLLFVLLSVNYVIVKVVTTLTLTVTPIVLHL